MKRVKLLLGILCVALMSSCCCNSGKDKACTAEGAEKSCAPKCEMSEEQKACCEKWKNFDNLSAEEQKELVDKKKACIDDCLAKRKAAIEEFEAELAEFDNLTVAEQKEFFDKKNCFIKKICYKENSSCTKKKECNKEEKKCTKAEE